MSNITQFDNYSCGEIQCFINGLKYRPFDAFKKATRKTVLSDRRKHLCGGGAQIYRNWQLSFCFLLFSSRKRNVSAIRYISGRVFLVAVTRSLCTIFISISTHFTASFVLIFAICVKKL